MALSLTTQVVHNKLRTKQLYIKAQASGLYIPGGDLLDLTKIVPAQGQANATIGYPGNIKNWGMISAPAGYSGLLSKGATLSTWGLQVFQTAAADPAGIPLGLSAASAAASTSAFDANGTLTVVVANTLQVGNYVVLAGGASAKSIFLTGVLLRVASASSTQFTAKYAAAKALTYVSAADAALTFQIVQAGSSANILQGVSVGGPVTGVLATASLLTITQVNTLQVGQFVTLDSLTAGELCQGVTVQVETATGTGWTAKWQGGVINQTAGEAGVTYLLCTNGGAPVQAYPQVNNPYAPISNSLAVAADATHAGLFTLTAVQAFQAGQLIVVKNLGVNTTANGSIATVTATGLTQALIKANGWTVIENTQAEVAGYAAVLGTGAAQNPTGELLAGAYPAGALAAPFIFVVEGPKLQM